MGQIPWSRAKTALRYASSIAVAALLIYIYILTADIIGRKDADIKRLKAVQEQEAATHQQTIDSLRKVIVKVQKAKVKEHQAAQQAGIQLDSQLVAHPLAEADSACKPYVEQVTTCQLQVQHLENEVAYSDQLLGAAILRAVAESTAHATQKERADSLLKAWPKDKLFGFIPKIDRTTAFAVGVLLGILGAGATH